MASASGVPVRKGASNCLITGVGAQAQKEAQPIFYRGPRRRAADLYIYLNRNTGLGVIIAAVLSAPVYWYLPMS